MTSHRIVGGSGVKLHVAEVGPTHAPPILFLHGFSQCGRAFHRQFAGPLSESHHLLAMDLRGHGQSDTPADAYGQARDWADDVAAVIAQFDLDRPVIVAWSYSGVVVLDYLRAYGADAVAGINLVGAVSKVGRGVVPFQGQEFLSLVPGFYVSEPETSEATLRRFIELCHETPLGSAEFETVLSYNMAVPPHVRRGLFARRIDNDDLLSRLDLPVLITQGARDPIVLPAMAEHNAGLIPGARVSLYEKAGHSLFLDDPQRFDRELADFVDECRGGSRTRAL